MRAVPAMRAFAFFLFVPFAFATDLRCYDCDPSSYGGCISPHTDNAKETICSQSPSSLKGLKKDIDDIDKYDIEPRISPDDREFECFSLYFDTESEETTGVYRGCTEKPKDLRSSCEYLRERIRDGNVTLCETCSDSVCNTHDVGGAAAFTASLTVILVNLILCLRVFNF